MPLFVRCHVLQLSSDRKFPNHIKTNEFSSKFEIPTLDLLSISIRNYGQIIVSWAAISVGWRTDRGRHHEPGSARSTNRQLGVCHVDGPELGYPHFLSFIRFSHFPDVIHFGMASQRAGQWKQAPAFNNPRLAGRRRHLRPALFTRICGKSTQSVAVRPLDLWSDLIWLFKIQ